MRAGWPAFVVSLAAGLIAVIICTTIAQVRLNAWNQPFYDAIPRRMDGTPEDVETSLESEVQHA
mgnify:CR=1 FL=1